MNKNNAEIPHESEPSGQNDLVWSKENIPDEELDGDNNEG